MMVWSNVCCVDTIRDTIWLVFPCEWVVMCKLLPFLVLSLSGYDLWYCLCHCSDTTLFSKCVSPRAADYWHVYHMEIVVLPIVS